MESVKEGTFGASRSGTVAGEGRVRGYRRNLRRKCVIDQALGQAYIGGTNSSAAARPEEDAAAAHRRNKNCDAGKNLRPGYESEVTSAVFG